MAVKIVIDSGKGGVVKSTLTTGLAAALASMDKRVLAIDCDIGLRSLDLIFGVRETVVYDWGDILMNRCEPAQVLLGSGGPKLLPAPLQFDDAYTPERFAEMVRFFEDDFDYILMDSPAGISGGFRLASSAASMAVAVSTPDDICVRGTAAAVRELRDINIQTVRLVINRFGKKAVLKKYLLNIDETIDETGAQLLGVVPEDPDTVYNMYKGRSLPKSSPAVNAFRRIAQRIEGRQVPLKLS